VNTREELNQMKNIRLETAKAIFDELHEVKEILESEIGEWLSVQQTYCPESIIPLKNALGLLEQTKDKYLAPPDSKTNDDQGASTEHEADTA
jgi:hypothetical protein